MGLVASLMLLLPLLLVPLLLVEVQCQQTFPYVSFMNQTLGNHSYVDISQVGTGSDAVQCHTDLSTCCSATQGPHRGDWYFPHGDRLSIPGSGDNIFESRQAQRVELRRNRGTGPTGIYRCDISTVAVHDYDYNNNYYYYMNETVYLGLYTSIGGKEYLKRNGLPIVWLVCEEGNEHFSSGNDLVQRTTNAGEPLLHNKAIYCYVCHTQNVEHYTKDMA